MTISTRLVAASVFLSFAFTGSAIAQSSFGDINFDGVTAPCTFAESDAVRDEFQQFGVRFEGPSADDGGALLNIDGGTCSNQFTGIEGESPTNVMAFDDSATLMDGGTPTQPEGIIFTQPVSMVSMDVANESGGSISIDCFDSQATDGSGNSLGSDSVNASSTMQTLSVSASGIQSCRLSYSGSGAVLDNIQFQAVEPPEPEPVPEPTPVPSLNFLSLLLLGLALTIGGFIAIKR